MTNKALVSTWNAWIENATDQRRKENLVLRYLARMTNHCFVQVWFSWVDAVAESKLEEQNGVILRRCIVKMANILLVTLGLDGVRMPPRRGGMTKLPVDAC